MAPMPRHRMLLGCAWTQNALSLEWTLKKDGDLHMKWIEMTVFTTEQGLDAVVARFDMLGIQQVIIEQGKESNYLFERS